MAAYKVELLAQAWLELDAIADYHLLAVGPDSARKITTRILRDLERLETFPLSCPLVPYRELAEQGYRMLVSRKYVCIYRLIGNLVYICHIAASAANYPSLFK